MPDESAILDESGDVGTIFGGFPFDQAGCGGAFDMAMQFGFQNHPGQPPTKQINAALHRARDNSLMRFNLLWFWRFEKQVAQ